MTRLIWNSLAILSAPVVCLAAEPSAVAPPPGLVSPPAVIDQHAAPVQLRSLRAVQDVRDRATKWENAAAEAVAKLPNKDLQDQVEKRLNTLTPQVAKDLLTTPGEVGVVTIAAYKEADAGDAVLVSVAYEGLGDTLNNSFFPRVVSDMPQLMRGEKKDSDQPLVLDVPASGYLIYELDKGDLKAGFIAQATMKLSLGAAVQQSRAKTAQIENAESRRDQVDAQRAAQDQAVQAAATQPSNTAPDPSAAAQSSADTTANPAYYGSNGYIGNDGGYYNTYGWAPYVVIPASGQEAERKRRELRRAAMEADHAANAQHQSGTPAPPPATATPQTPPATPPQTPATPRPAAPPRPAPAPAPAPAPTPAPKAK